MGRRAWRVLGVVVVGAIFCGLCCADEGVKVFDICEP